VLVSAAAEPSKARLLPTCVCGLTPGGRVAPRVTAAEYAAVVGSTFAARQLDLAKAMRDASSTVAPGHLKDFDWKVQVSGRAGVPALPALAL
jgi:hypothetical protein